MERILDRPANYDHDFDGRPPVGEYGSDVLLERLCRFHPELIPDDLAVKIKTGRPQPPAPCAADIPAKPPSAVPCAADSR